MQHRRLTTGAACSTADDSFKVGELIDELTEASGTAAALVDTNFPADDRFFSADNTLSAFSTDFLWFGGLPRPRFTTGSGGGMDIDSS